MDDAYLEPTAMVDSDHPEVVAYARAVTGKCTDTLGRAVRLYYAVRDGIRYDPYLPFHRPEHYRASAILRRGRGFCVCKASLLCALARACGIPSRVGFADVRNHLASRQLIEYLGSNIFVYHGYTEFYLANRWVKSTPAFNAELCTRHGVDPLEFDGRSDSLFQPYNNERKQFMEYVAEHGTYPDIPVDTIVAAWKEAYGHDRVEEWIAGFDDSPGRHHRDFSREDVWPG